MLTNRLQWTAVVAVTSVVASSGAGVGMARDAPPWLEALDARSDALNREHGLGDYGKRRVLGQPAPGWLASLRARSEAMNRYYGLGVYARQGAHGRGAPDWLVALNARSDALNRAYGLGEHAARETRTP